MNYNIGPPSSKRLWPALASVIAMVAVTPAFAAPSISQVSGTFGHKATATISGSGFGSKENIAPIVWDDASGTSILEKWDGAWPDCGNSAYFTRYTTPIRGIGLPHANVSKYIAGAHGENGYDTGCGGRGGPDVMFWKSRTISSFPAYSYISFYYRADNNWVFGLGTPADENFKTFHYDRGAAPYITDDSWYTNLFGLSKAGAGQWGTSNPLMNPDMNGHNTWWEGGLSPMAGSWIKIEYEMKYTSQNNGYIKLYENGVKKIDYSGPTEFTWAGTSRTEAIGGYARGYGNPNNWRYFADVYLDHTLARVVLANNTNLANATIIEPQIPYAWSNGSIGITVNLGKFTTGQTAYLFVVDSSGAPSATGYAITVGSSGGTTPTPLGAATNLRIISP